ncbi:cytochrome-b5 reductase [Cryptococcus neoformans var. grubii Br795]|nr:cytochrome-b5 reductase [Cryptococcus neoformans var. grubii Br795]
MITDADEREGARDNYAVLDGTLSRGCVISHFPITQPRSVLLVAGGGGITPIYSLAREILTAHAGDQKQVELLWGVNGMNDIVLKDELEELEQKYPERLKVTYAVSGTGKMGEGRNSGRGM